MTNDLNLTGEDTREGCEQQVCWCHLDPKPVGFFCNYCGCRVIRTEGA